MAMAIQRANSFHLLLSDDELRLLRLLAEREGQNASDYLRMLIRRQADSPQAQILAALLSGKALGEDFDYARALGFVREAAASAKKKR
jgi:hypothetical protein